MPGAVEDRTHPVALPIGLVGHRNVPRPPETAWSGLPHGAERPQARSLAARETLRARKSLPQWFAGTTWERDMLVGTRPVRRVETVNFTGRSGHRISQARWVTQLLTALAKRSRYLRCRSALLSLSGPRSNSTFSIVPLKYFGNTLVYSNFGTTGRPLSVPISMPA
jgi:hypothetical protein